MPRKPPSLVIRHHDPARVRKITWVLLVVWLLSLAIVALAVSEWIPHAGGNHGGDQQRTLKRDLDDAQTQLVVLKRSEQVARAAIDDMRGTLREREEEIEGLRSDLAFYARLVGGSKREGLAVPELTLKPVGGSNAWNFSATITQNFKRDKEMQGNLSLSVEGVTRGKLHVLDWSTLQQHADAKGVGYSFKYFERVSGTIMLPPDFEPNRVRVHLDGDGTPVNQEFAWKDAVKGEETQDVQK